MEPWLWLFAYLVVVVAIGIIAKLSGDEWPWQLLIPFIVGAILRLAIPVGAVAGIGFVTSLLATIVFWRIWRWWHKRQQRRNYLVGRTDTFP